MGQNDAAALPQNMAEVYALLTKTPGLCGEFELVSDDEIHYSRGNLLLKVCAGWLGVYVVKKRRRELTHWHPDTAAEAYRDLLRIARKGSVLVVKTWFLGGSAEIIEPENSGKKICRGLGKVYRFPAD